MLAHLGRQREAIAEEGPDSAELVKAFVDKALASGRGIDRTFWLLATADVINEEPEEEQRSLLRLAARRIHATFSVPHEQRLAATRFLHAKVISVA